MENNTFTGPSAELAELGARHFGRRVRELRSARGYTQEHLARVLSMTGRSFHQTTVAKLESGSRPTSVEELHLLAAILGVEVEDFFKSEDDDAVVHAELAREATKLAELASSIATAVERTAQMKQEYEAGELRYDALMAKLSPAGRAELERSR